MRGLVRLLLMFGPMIIREVQKQQKRKEKQQRRKKPLEEKKHLKIFPLILEENKNPIRKEL